MKVDTSDKIFRAQTLKRGMKEVNLVKIEESKNISISPASGSVEVNSIRVPALDQHDNHVIC